MNDQISYLAIDPADEDEPSYLVNSDTIDRAAGFQLQDNVKDAPPDLLTNASVRASWATLADFSGNMPALDRWAPSVMLRRLAREPRPRVEFDTPYGPARGTTVIVDVAGQRLRVSYAVDASIDHELTQRPEAIADAQSAFAERLTAFSDGPDEISAAPSEQRHATLYSATPDGSIFSVSPE